MRRRPRRRPRTARRARSRRSMHALACPASLKGVLAAREAATALAQGFRRGGVEADELPVADGGEGTADVLGAEGAEVYEVAGAFGRPRAARGLRLGSRTV